MIYMKKIISRNKIFLLCLALLLIASGMVISALIWDYNISEVRDIPMYFFVESVGAFNTDTDAIYFGSAPRGSSGVRDIHLESDEELHVTAITLGNISSIVTISENDFMIGPDNPKTLRMAAKAPLDDPYITAYTGTLRLVFRRF